MPDFEAAYLELHRRGVLIERAKQAEAMLHDCRLCGWDCGIDRALELGPCRVGIEFKVATAYRHFGEEGPLVEGGGSGAIFFSNCELRCQFCQTSRWNIKGQGVELLPDQLASIMIDLQADGAANINLVTPTHLMPQIMQALVIAAERGLTLPLVWNSAGYESDETLRLLDGIIDIYLPDMKYSDSTLGRKLSVIPDYPTVNQRAVREMLRQVGPLTLDEGGRAVRGVLIRHLVMPGMLENTREVLTWIAANGGPHTYVSLMDQYRPAYRASARPPLDRALTLDEFQQALHIAGSLGLTRLDPHRVLSPH